MRPIACLLMLVLLCDRSSQAQPAIEWQRTFGGTLDDTSASIAETSDGGYILCGTTYSNNGHVTGNHGNGDIWVVKLNATGDIQWQRCLGGSQPDIGRSVLPLADGGYLVLGSTRSNDGDASGNHGMVDIWLVRLNASGTPVWQRCYGGSLNDVPFGIKPTPDGGYIIAGESRSSDGDLTSNAGFADYWVLKIDSDGDIQWQRSYGGSGGDTAYAIELTTDGGYILNGLSTSTDGDVTNAPVAGAGPENYWVVKLDALGNIQWQRPCGGSNTDYGFSVAQLDDGTYVAFGTSYSTDGDVTDSRGGGDYWLVRLTSTGMPVGYLSFGGSNNDAGAEIIQAHANGLLLSGASASNDGDVEENFGSFDGWLVRTHPNGTIAWRLTIGGGQSDGLGVISLSNDGGYVVIGTSRSSDGGIPGNQGGSDVWVVKLGADPVGLDELHPLDARVVHPNPCNTHLFISSALPGLGPVRWSVVDRSGSIVAQGILASLLEPVPTEHLARGQYVLQFESEGNMHCSPFVKE